VRQLAGFDIFFRKYEVLFLDDINIIEQACKIHADLKIKGRPMQDADVLIAATAITRSLVLVSSLYLAPGLTTRFLNDKLWVLSYSLCKKPGFSGLVENAAFR
jgi:hypothetical protein